MDFRASKGLLAIPDSTEGLSIQTGSSMDISMLTKAWASIYLSMYLEPWQVDAETAMPRAKGYIPATPRHYISSL